MNDKQRLLMFEQRCANYQQSELALFKRIYELQAALEEIYQIAADDHDDCAADISQIAAIADRARCHRMTTP
jgi:hypothetical protein